MAETIARIGKEVTGRYAEVTASVSNFVPKPHTPYQWNGMQTREYFHWAHRYLRIAGQDPVGHGQVPRHRAEPARRHPDPRRPPGRRRRSRRPGGAGPGSTPGPSTSTPGSGGRPSTTWASTSPSTASASGRSTRSSPGTTSTSRRAASTWPRSRTARSSSSRRWPGRSERTSRVDPPEVPSMGHPCESDVADSAGCRMPLVSPPTGPRPTRGGVASPWFGLGLAVGWTVAPGPADPERAKPTSTATWPSTA